MAKSERLIVAPPCFDAFQRTRVRPQTLRRQQKSQRTIGRSMGRHSHDFRPKRCADWRRYAHRISIAIGQGSDGRPSHGAGAGEGNRTLVVSLGSFCSTISDNAEYKPYGALLQANRSAFEPERTGPIRLKTDET
jgi:hypothetical protein